MQDNLYELLMKLPKKNLINLMWAALDEMQGFNGRSRMFCIMESMGVPLAPDDNNNQTKWVKPNLADIRKNTDAMGL